MIEVRLSWQRDETEDERKVRYQQPRQLAVRLWGNECEAVRHRGSEAVRQTRSGVGEWLCFWCRRPELEAARQLAVRSILRALGSRTRSVEPVTRAWKQFVDHPAVPRHYLPGLWRPLTFTAATPHLSATVSAQREERLTACAFHNPPSPPGTPLTPGF